jgi:hypothetical protein
MRASEGVEIKLYDARRSAPREMQARRPACPPVCDVRRRSAGTVSSATRGSILRTAGSCHQNILQLLIVHFGGVHIQPAPIQHVR